MFASILNDHYSSLNLDPKAAAVAGLVGAVTLLVISSFRKEWAPSAIATIPLTYQFLNGVGMPITLLQTTACVLGGGALKICGDYLFKKAQTWRSWYEIQKQSPQMELMKRLVTPKRLLSTTALGAGAGWGVATLCNGLDFELDPKAMAIAAAIGALFFAASSTPLAQNYLTHFKKRETNPQLFTTQLMARLGSAAFIVAYAALKFSKYNTTISQVAVGVALGFEANLLVDYFYQQAPPHAKETKKLNEKTHFPLRCFDVEPKENTYGTNVTYSFFFNSSCRRICRMGCWKVIPLY